MKSHGHSKHSVVYNYYALLRIRKWLVRNTSGVLFHATPKLHEGDKRSLIMFLLVCTGLFLSLFPDTQRILKVIP